jgi:hypothetical protein
VARQDEAQGAVQRAGGARGHALEERLFLDLAHVLRPAFFFLQLALALRIGVPRQQREPQRDDMGADDAAFDVVAAGTAVFAEWSGRIRAAVLMERLPQEMVPWMPSASADASRTRPRSNRVRPSRKVTAPPQSCSILYVNGNFTMSMRRFFRKRSNETKIQVRRKKAIREWTKRFSAGNSRLPGAPAPRILLPQRAPPGFVPARSRFQAY